MNNMEETELTRVKKELDELKTRIDIQQEQLLKDLVTYSEKDDISNISRTLSKLSVIDNIKNTATEIEERGKAIS